MIGLRIAWTAPFVLAAPVLAQYGSDLPTVDLGYEIYRANSFNETGQYYNFSNVRYAAAPVGDLRFRAPQPPEVDRSSVNDGSQGRVCAQGLPAWIELATGFVSRYFTNQGNNITQSDVDLANFSVNAQSVMKTLDPRTTEDCLFLDVMVPQNIWQNKGNGDGAPVLVWIYGGGYVFGDKTEYYPAGLIYRSEANNAGGVIFVALNYRLGAFGCELSPYLIALQAVEANQTQGLLARRFRKVELPTLVFMTNALHCNGCRNTYPSSEEIQTALLS